MGFILSYGNYDDFKQWGGPKTFEIKMPQESHLNCKEAERSFELNLPRLGAFVLVESKCLSITDANNPSIFT